MTGIKSCGLYRAIVGSAIIKLPERPGTDAPGYVGEYVRAMAGAVVATN